MEGAQTRAMPVEEDDKRQILAGVEAAPTSTEDDGNVQEASEDEKEASSDLEESVLHPQDEKKEQVKEEEDDDDDDEEEVSPQLGYVRDIRTGRMVRIDEMEMPSVLAREHQTTIAKLMQRLRSSRRRFVGVKDLRVGDVLFVLETSIVSVSQTLTRLFSSEMGRSGGADAVHVSIVVEAASTHALVGRPGNAIHSELSSGIAVSADAVLGQVAHVTNDGGVVSLLQGHRASHQEPYPMEARVHRLVCKAAASFSVPHRAAEIAVALAESGAIRFSRTSSIASAFRDPAVGRYLAQSKHHSPAYRRPPPTADRPMQHQHQHTDSSHDKRIEMFCTEFVIKCYQTALVNHVGLDSRELMNAVDVDGASVTPMFLEGFLRQNSGTTAQWLELGTLRFDYG